MEAELLEFVQGGQAAQAVYTNNEEFPQINVNKEELIYKNVINEKLSYKSISLKLIKLRFNKILQEKMFHRCPLFHIV